jgi:prolyl 4-hydroxylase
MKEEKFKLDNFIGGWYIDPKVCDDLVKYFENNKHRHQVGKTGNIINKEKKKSIDIGLSADDTLLDEYNNELQKCLLSYVKKYPELNYLARFNSYVEGYNIQRYKSGEGYYKLHCERDSHNSRCLVFMTYLNTVKDGGTIFKYQKITTPAEKGLTLIWPTDFTHMHQGQICNETKYIITGWYNFL